MAWRSKETPPPPARGVLDELCDRCVAGAKVRVGKDIGEPVESYGGGIHVELREMDLVFCRDHFGRYEQRLRAERFRVLDDRR